MAKKVYYGHSKKDKDGFLFCNGKGCDFYSKMPKAMGRHVVSCPHQIRPNGELFKEASKPEVKAEPKAAPKVQSTGAACSSVTWSPAGVIGEMTVAGVAVKMNITNIESKWVASWAGVKASFDTLEHAKGEFPKIVEHRILVAHKAEKLRKEIDRLQAELNSL
jgi:hypothetical protein